MSTGLSSLSDPQHISDAQKIPISNPYWKDSEKPPYQADQQLKFLHLAAEVESLWQQVQSIEQQRLDAANIQYCEPQLQLITD